MKERERDDVSGRSKATLRAIRQQTNDILLTALAAFLDSCGGRTNVSSSGGDRDEGPASAAGSVEDDGAAAGAERVEEEVSFARPDLSKLRYGEGRSGTSRPGRGL